MGWENISDSKKGGGGGKQGPSPKSATGSVSYIFLNLYNVQIAMNR